jgi:hypothetical protein
VNGTLLWVAPVVAIGALAAWNPNARSGPVLCPFRRCTGVACPGCGLTRALGALVRGNLDTALRLHPLVLLVAVDAFALWVAALVRQHRPTRWATNATSAGSRSSRLTMAVVTLQALLFIAVWGIRLADGSIHVVE